MSGEFLQALRGLYLNEAIELQGMLSARSNQPMAAEQLQKLKQYNNLLYRMIPYLRLPQDRVPKEFNKDKVDAFEKQIVNIMETYRRSRHGMHRHGMQRHADGISNPHGKV